jgi:hypothetical protein
MHHRSLLWLFLLLGACENQSPIAPEIAIKPAAPTTTDDLELVFVTDSTDKDGDQIDQTISWLKEGVVQWELEDKTTVAASYTSKGENWEVVVVASDGLSTPTNARKGATIQNSAPRLDSVSISPADPTGASTLQAEAIFMDEDGDNVTLSYVWTRKDDSGSTETTDYTDSYVPGEATAKNETWTVEVTPLDGEDAGEVGSATVVIANAAPEILSLSLSPDPVYTLTDLVASVSTLDADGDTVSVTYEWTVNGTRKNDTDNTLDYDQFVKGDEVALTVTPNDGLQDGDAVTSDTVTIQNSLPTLTGVILSSDESDWHTGFETSTLTCIPENWADADGDTEEYSFNWTVNSLVLTATGDVIGGDLFDKHDLVACIAWPMNGSEAGAEWTSAEMEIQNSVPEIADAALTNLTPTENDIVEVTYTGTDADGDTLTPIVVWNSVGGDIPQTTALSIDGAIFDRWDTFFADVSLHDGETSSLHAQTTEATVGNAPPVVTSVTLNGTEFSANQSMAVAAVGSDADGDSVTVSTLTWFVNGSSVNSIDSALLTPADIGGTKGDIIHVEATLADLYGGVSSPLPSTAVTVIDTPPSINNLFTDSTANDTNGTPRSNADVTVYFELVDIDSADTPSADVQWTSNASALFSETVTGTSGGASTALQSTLPASTHGLVRGDTLSVQVTPSANGATGTAATTTITLGNALPVISGLTLTPDPPGTDDTLALNVTNAFDRDGDPVTLGYAWSVNGTAISAATTSTLDGSSFFSKGQTVMVVTTPYDGLGYGFPQTMSRTVANYPTNVVGIGLSASEAVNQENDVVCSITNSAYDPDGDAIDYEFSWRIDESVNGGAWRDFGDVYGDATYETNYPEDSVEASEVFEGETLECTVTATDDEGLALTVSEQVTPIPEPCGSGAASWNSDTGSYVELDGGTSGGGLDFGDFTVEAWVSPTGPGNPLLSSPFIGAKGSGAVFWQMGWIASGGATLFGVILGDTNSIFHLSADADFWPKLNSWHHVALSGEEQSNGTMKYRLFVDGRLVDTVTRTNPPPAITNPIRIGQMDGIANEWPGKVDEVRISGAAIYTEDFQPEMRLSEEGDTLALYHLDDGSGSNSATDETGSGVYGNGTANQAGVVSWSTESVCDVAGDIEKIALGNEAGCWLTSDGEIDCWGLNHYPNYGSNDPADIAMGVVDGHPTASGYQDVDIATYHACAVDQSGCIECWGDYLGQYRSGDNNGGGGTNAQPTATECVYESVVVGKNHNCGIKTDGTVHCWGWNIPVGVISGTPTGTTFSQLSANNNVTCGIQDDSTAGLYCWGNSSYFLDSAWGAPSFGLSDLEITNSAACGINDSDGRVVCWGYDIESWNRTGQFPNSSFADPMPAIYDASGVGISHYAGCAANGTGQVQCWGHPGYSPAAPGVYQDVAGGLGHFCGLTTYGRVLCWGEDDWGETNPPNH